MTGRRVVITGIGAVTPIGAGVDGLWQGIRAERSAVRAVSRFDPEPFRSRCAGQVDDFDPVEFLGAKRSKRMDRCSQFALAASRMALEDSGIRLEAEDRDRTGALMGTALGGVALGELQHERYLAGGIRAVDPGVALTVFAGAASCNVAIEFGITGPNLTNGMSCASGAIAIGEAFRTIQRDEADLVFAGGSEAPLAPLTYGAFALIRAMSTRNDDPAGASRPFDVDRDGFVMAEGAAVLLLEERGRALARGARIYAEVVGFGLSNDAYHMAAPLPGGGQAARAMAMALRTAGIGSNEVGYINAHGSATPLNDPTETRAIRTVFGDQASRIPISGTKGYYGHALGASGAIEAAICALASTHRWIPPTVNLAVPDPTCDLDYTPGTGRTADPEFILSNSFGFGGINAALVFRRAT
ncbi:MAG: beta-ketoacyl-ACP synthase II [Gemmatimonadales bacterium]|nr:beta-ketoacyl-ACP synthase II [Gemmatimonadales bacterium]